jgi:hypothetical protein
MTYALTWLPQVLLDAGLRVAVQPGWETRGRGDVGVIRGVICHHTGARQKGNAPSLGVVTNGRPDLPGPLAQLCLGRDGAYYVVAAGVANHAGRGAWGGVDSGNASFIGIEAENSGLADDPWPEVQLQAYRRGVAAILAQVKAPANMCCGHKEYATPKGRKTDPGFDMAVFRAGVSAILAGTTPRPAPILAADPLGRPTLRRPIQGPFVTAAQQLLGVEADGLYGPTTEAAVRAFQRSCGLVPDGITGPKTWSALRPRPG